MMASYTEYDRLTDVVLGSVENYSPSIWTWNINEEYLGRNWDYAKELLEDVIPNQIKTEVVEDLNSFEKILTSEGVNVVRPATTPEIIEVTGSSYYAYGQDFYNMRDLHCVFGKSLISASPSQPNRISEIHKLSNFFSELAQRYNLELVESPKPALLTNPEFEFIPENKESCNPVVKTMEVWHRLTEEEILFDAANLIRMRDSAIFLVSSTGNRKAYDWFSKNITSHKIELTDVYRSSHLDSTILPLSDEYILVNSERVNKTNTPLSIKSKRLLFFNEVEEVPEWEKKFHYRQRRPAAEKLKELGFHSNLREISSKWAGINVLSLSPSEVFVESRQLRLIALLESLDFRVIKVQVRHPYTFLGGLHCTTLDIGRVC